MEIECQLCRKAIATTKLYGYHSCVDCKDFFEMVTIEEEEEDLSYIWTFNNTLYTVYGETFYMKVGLNSVTFEWEGIAGYMMDGEWEIKRSLYNRNKSLVMRDCERILAERGNLWKD